MVISIKQNGNWVEVPALQGSQGEQGIQGPAGDNGNDYVITSADYSAIAAVVYNDYMTNAENVGY